MDPNIPRKVLLSMDGYQIMTAEQGTSYSTVLLTSLVPEGNLHVSVFLSGKDPRASQVRGGKSNARTRMRSVKDPRH